MKTLIRTFLSLLLFSTSVFAESNVQVGPAIAVGDHGLVLSKPTGGQWSRLVIPKLDAKELRTASYNPTLKQYVIAGMDKNFNGLIAIGSADGSSWRKVVGTGMPYSQWAGTVTSIAIQGEQYVAVCSRRILSSKNGIDWTDVTGNLSLQGDFTSVTVGLDENKQTQFVVVGGEFVSGVPGLLLPLIARGSGDGVWKKTILPNTGSYFASVTYNMDLHQYVANSLSQGQNPVEHGLYLSKDAGKTFKLIRQANRPITFWSVNYIPFAKQYVVLGTDDWGDAIFTSVDGEKWETIHFPEISLDAISFSRSTPAQYIGMGQTHGEAMAAIQSSADGVSWKQELPNENPDSKFPDEHIVGIAAP